MHPHRPCLQDDLASLEAVSTAHRTMAYDHERLGKMLKASRDDAGAAERKEQAARSQLACVLLVPAPRPPPRQLPACWLASRGLPAAGPFAQPRLTKPFLALLLFAQSQCGPGGT